jgi:hypothetical protein
MRWAGGIALAVVALVCAATAGRQGQIAYLDWRTPESCSHLRCLDATPREIAKVAKTSIHVVHLTKAQVITFETGDTTGPWVRVGAGIGFLLASVLTGYFAARLLRSRRPRPAP